MNLKIVNDGMRLKLIPELIIESESNYGRITKFREIEEFKEYSKQIEGKYNIFNYKDIISKYNALEFSEEHTGYHYPKTSDHVFVEDATKLFDIFPHDIQKKNIPKNTTENIFVAMSHISYNYMMRSSTRSRPYTRFVRELYKSIDIDISDLTFKDFLQFLMSSYKIPYSYGGRFSIIFEIVEMYFMSHVDNGVYCILLEDWVSGFNIIKYNNQDNAIYVKYFDHNDRPLCTKGGRIHGLFHLIAYIGLANPPHPYYYIHRKFGHTQIVKDIILSYSDYNTDIITKDVLDNILENMLKDPSISDMYNKTSLNKMIFGLYTTMFVNVY